MPSTKTIKLILAVIAVGGLIVIVGATVNNGTTAAPSKPIVRQIMRRKDNSKLPASANEIAELRRKAQDQEKRTLKTREFKDMPLKYHMIRNLESETWYKDLQIEVKNIGTKPIYFILAYLEFPDHKAAGRDTGFALTFGDLKNWGIDVLADPQDQHLDPGQTYVFTIPAKTARGLGRQHERAPEEFKKLDFHIDIISFGDGTGFEIGRLMDSRKAKPPDEGREKKKHHVNRLSYSAVRSPPQDGCGSCGRYKTQGQLTCFNLYLNEWCAPSPTIQVDPSKPCRLYRTTYTDCDDDGFEECPQDVIYDSEICPGYAPPSPTPSPTPTPEPTCDPATKPNNTNCSCDTSLIAIGGSPRWSCFCVYTDNGLVFGGDGADYHAFPGAPGHGGCDVSHNKINNGGDCCVCAITVCPEGSSLNRGTCQCETSGGSSGGGGGPAEPPPAVYKQDCVDFYWVHFVSHDGGQTWQYDDRETYAGCYYVY